MTEKGLPPYRGRGRGRGCGSFGMSHDHGIRGRGSYHGGRGRGIHFSTQSYQTSNNFPDAHLLWFPQSSLGHDEEGLSTNASRQVARLQAPHHPYRENPLNDPSLQSFQFMARIKYCSTVATCGEEKTNDALIASGGSHHFFYKKRFFIEYKSIKNKDVQQKCQRS